jgi:sugar phosphate isomerase/epimerase
LADHRFGVSTHLFHESRLTRDHLVHIAAHGFETVELFATRTHFDYHDPQSIDRLAEWLADTRLELHSVHAPIVEGMANGRWVGSYSNAAGDEKRRGAALAETRAALELARRIPYRFLVTHLGMPTVEQVPPPLDSARGVLSDSRRTSHRALARYATQNANFVLVVDPHNGPAVRSAASRVPTRGLCALGWK